MNRKQIVAKTLETAFGENPEIMALIASAKDEQIEVVFETLQAPAIAASIVLSSQDAAKKIEPSKLTQGVVWNFESSAQITPAALDVKLIEDGEVLCINIGSGALYFRLSDPAKRSLDNIGSQKV